MKKLFVLSCFIMFLLFALPGCSMESAVETGIKMLDNAFAGSPSPQHAQAEEPTVSNPSTPLPSPTIQAEEPIIPSDTQVKEPNIPDADNSVPVPDTLTIEASHSDITFFNPKESIRFLPKGISGEYSCTYETENDAVASVDQETGKVTAVGPGTTNVIMHLEYNGQHDFTCIVRCNWKDEAEPVLPPNERNQASTSTSKHETDSKPDSLPAQENPAGELVSASHSDATFFNPKEHFTLRAIGAEDAICTYVSSNPEIASVDDDGVVRAVAPGTTTVTMTVDCGGTDYVFNCIVRCNWENDS